VAQPVPPPPKLISRNAKLVMALAIVIIAALALGIVVFETMQPSWITIDSWKTMINNVYVDSNCNFTSNQFRINGEQWRLSWTSGGEMPLGSHFDIKIYNDDSGTMVKEIVTSSNQGDSAFTEGGAYYPNIQGDFHIQVSILGELPNWTFEIDEYK
jgi:hypothetical protein